MRGWSVFGFLGILMVLGCGVSKSKLNTAKTHVQEALDHWKKGGKPDELKSRTPAIEFFEEAWNTGATLMNYDMGDVRYDDRTKVIRCEVRLTTRVRQNKEQTETVWYDVKLDSPIKIVNNPMP